MTPTPPTTTIAMIYRELAAHPSEQLWFFDNQGELGPQVLAVANAHGIEDAVKEVRRLYASYILR